MKRRSFFKKCGGLIALGIAGKVYPTSSNTVVRPIKFTPNPEWDTATYEMRFSDRDYAGKWTFVMDDLGK